MGKPTDPPQHEAEQGEKKNDVMFSRSRMFDRADEALAESRRKRELAALEKTARWGQYSMIVAVLALALSAWPYIRSWLP